MKSISIENVKPGMAFSKDVFIEEDSLFTPARIPIKEKDLERIRGWGIEEIQTDGVEFKPDLESTSGSIENLGKVSSDKIKPLYNTAIINLFSLFTNYEAKKQTEAKSYKDVLDSILQFIIESPEEWLNYALEAPRDENNLAQNAVNTMIYSLAIAEKTKFEMKEKEELGMAALLHDVGMLKIPDSIKNKKGKLSPQELEKIKTHTIHTYRFITSELGMDDSIGRIALLHHERWDGKGYPRQLAKKQIPLAARILSIADAFEAMVKETPYRDSLIGYTAVRQILNDNSRRFDADIIKVFIKRMGIYPVGSYVILNDGSVGVVSKINPEAPLRPSVRILLTKDGNKVENVMINLIEKVDTFIARPFKPKDLKNKK